jgi:hypothetical protein
MTENASGALVAAALHYATLGWSIFPVSEKKVPLCEHGRSDATRDPAQIRSWLRRWPHALVAIATGEESGVVALDVDVKPGAYGPDALEALGVVLHPVTPTAHTPSGGYHLLFRHPGHFMKTVAGKLGAGLDIRGDGGSLTVPPGPGRSWDSHFGLDTPLADFPDWAVIPEPVPKPAPARSHSVKLSRYAEAALENSLRRMLEAGAGKQRDTLNSEAYGLGQLVAAGELPADVALAELDWCASKVRALDPRRPWRPGEVAKIVREAFLDGLREPRRRRHG